MLQLLNEIYIDDQLSVFDHIKLTPDSQKITSIGNMEGFTHLGSMIVVSEKVNANLLDRLYELFDPKTDQYSVGISLLPVSGFTIRVLANFTQTIERLICSFRQRFNVFFCPIVLRL